MQQQQPLVAHQCNPQTLRFCCQAGGTEEERRRRKEEGEVDVGQVVLRTEIICGVQVRERNIMGRWKMQDSLCREDYLGPQIIGKEPSC